MRGISVTICRKVGAYQMDYDWLRVNLIDPFR